MGNEHYENEIGLHNEKGDIEIEIQGTTYYNFDKLVELHAKLHKNSANYF